MRNLKLFDLDFICPDVVTQQDKMALEQVLESQPGIEEVDIDVALHRVHVRCADSDGESDVRRHLSAAGYPPED